jgi:uncharacterized protein (UPF0276 family)
MAHSYQSQPLRDHAPIPACAGVGLRSLHHHDALNSHAKTGWLEVHSENYFGKGGAPLRYLESIRADYPISLHGVGLSLGSADELDYQYLRKLKDLIARIEPGLVSEHLSWSSFAGHFLNDLLPVPYTQKTLAHLVARIDEVQEFLGRQLLLENPSSYLEYDYSTYSESSFINELAHRSGCAILLDINNVYVSCFNHGWNPLDYIQDIAVERVAEIHLAGHTVNIVAGRNILIDTHNGPVSESVWQLYHFALRRFGRVPTLIEWDADLPDWQVLIAEADKADAYLEKCYAQAA